MLRTHSELGYRQEQRFHLELGLLKMSHAQRLLPMEQLLSGATPERAAAPERKLSLAPDARKPEPPAAPRPFISPFAADSARKGTPRSEGLESTTPYRPAQATPSAQPVVMGSAAPAVVPAPESQPQTESQPQSKIEPKLANSDDVRSAVLSTLASAGLSMLSQMLEAGEWQIDGNQLTIRVASSATLIDLSVSNDAKRMIIAIASSTLGRAVRLQIVPGANVQPGAIQPGAPKPASNGGSRGRAEQEPVVQRMKEKFGAEIRTVIDYRK
jgi:DNA polymerase-3 subunit gamma/tau